MTLGGRWAVFSLLWALERPSQDELEDFLFPRLISTPLPQLISRPARPPPYQISRPHPFPESSHLFPYSFQAPGGCKVVPGPSRIAQEHPDHTQELGAAAGSRDLVGGEGGRGWGLVISLEEGETGSRD